MINLKREQLKCFVNQNVFNHNILQKIHLISSIDYIISNTF